MASDILSAQPSSSLFAGMAEQEFQQWRHNPITAAFLQFLKDQADNFRLGAVDLWEGGRLDPTAPVHINSNVLLGRVLTLNELYGLRLTSIQEFYKETGSDEGTPSV